MALRSALILLGAATACLGAGWVTGLGTKPRPAVASTFAEADPQPPKSAQPVAPAEDATFKTKIQPFLKKYCVECHSGEKPKAGLTLDAYQSEAHARKDRKNWGAVQHALAANDMPPPKSKRPQPTKEEREFVINWIETTLTKVDCGANTPRDPGRVTIRRLNRAEYNNTIRDLCGVDVKPAEDFPTDDVGYGFDNIGDVLSFQPVLLEKYMTAADRVLAAALKIEEPAKTDKQTFRPQQINATPRSAKVRTFENGRQIDKIIFTSSSSNSEEAASLPQNYNFTADGEYVLRFRGWGTKVGDEFPKVIIRVDGKDVGTFTVDAEQGKAKTYETKPLKFAAGEKRVAVVFSNPFADKDEKKSREFGLETIEVEGPFNPVAPPLSDSVKKLLFARPAPDAKPDAVRAGAEKVLAAFATRAYRRPVKAEELARLVKLFDLATKQGEKFEVAIRLPMKAVLVSPHFLYRIEEDPKNPNDVRTISDFEFATRLSYFLWSSMPDEELFKLATQGELRKPAVLEAQVKRMLKDPKAKALSENFAGQWLQLRMLKTLTPDKGYFPAWDELLKESMAREAELYFEYVVQNDRSILEFIDSDYTFVNGRLARHYGIENVTGLDFQKVKLPDGRRGGVVTMGSTLTVTSNPTRTSPVKRGKWILENILGTPPPPPAPDVPELPATAELKGTLRQQMEQHRANVSCAVCHAKLDPLGFGLENFDGVGGWRTQDNKQPIDASGVLPGGEKFNGPAELRKVLVGKADMFRRCFAEKLLTFGLGRGLEYYDKCALDEIVSASKANQDTFSALVLAIVKSDPFQKRKGKRSE
jgi:hypothetical protein